MNLINRSQLLRQLLRLPHQLRGLRLSQAVESLLAGAKLYFRQLAKPLDQPSKQVPESLLTLVFKHFFSNKLFYARVNATKAPPIRPALL